MVQTNVTVDQPSEGNIKDNVGHTPKTTKMSLEKSHIKNSFNTLTASDSNLKDRKQLRD